MNRAVDSPDHRLPPVLHWFGGNPSGGDSKPVEQWSPRTTDCLYFPIGLEAICGVGKAICRARNSPARRRNLPDPLRDSNLT